MKAPLTWLREYVSVDATAHEIARLTDVLERMLPCTDVDVDRHREALAAIRDAGATWVSFAFDFSTQAETLDFVQGFGETYLGADRV